MASERDIEEAFERGRSVGQREGLAFAGVPRLGALLPGARFSFSSSWFESFAEYERDVVVNLRLVQRERWLRDRGGLKAMASMRPGRRGPDLERVEEQIKAELREARRAVDAELAGGRGQACVVAALRASPQRPASVVEYESVDAFVAQDRRRAVGDWPARKDLGGADYGYEWGLESSFRRWNVTSWRISWLCNDGKFMFGGDDALHGGEDGATTEVYAIELFERKQEEIPSGRVWLLGKLRTRASVESALQDLQTHAMRERNSLVAAADSVALASRAEGASST